MVENNQLIYREASLIYGHQKDRADCFGGVIQGVRIMVSLSRGLTQGLLVDSNKDSKIKKRGLCLRLGPATGDKNFTTIK